MKSVNSLDRSLADIAPSSGRHETRVHKRSSQPPCVQNIHQDTRCGSTPPPASHCWRSTHRCLTLGRPCCLPYQRTSRRNSCVSDSSLRSLCHKHRPISDHQRQSSPAITSNFLSLSLSAAFSHTDRHNHHAARLSSVSKNLFLSE